ncbi:MAG TPA: glycosyltransferase family 2 protein [bacterium]|nr:glycosyltransferase family 2 protein [bacterium]
MQQSSQHQKGQNLFFIENNHVENKPILSIVVPAYNEGQRIAHTLSQSYRYLTDQQYDFEIIVVDDGSTDTTVDIVRGFFPNMPRLKLIRHRQNQGKGAAVKTGMLRAGGEWIMFVDADMATPIAMLERLWSARNQFDILIGSRYLQSDSIKTPQPFYRKLIARGGNYLIKTMLDLSLSDTQCGFKLFKKPVAQDLFARQNMTGWSFDIEILVLAKILDYSVGEIAVDWHDQAGSHVDPIKDSLKVLKEVFFIRQTINSSLRNKTAYTQNI